MPFQLPSGRVRSRTLLGLKSKCLNPSSWIYLAPDKIASKSWNQKAEIKKLKSKSWNKYRKFYPFWPNILIFDKNFDFWQKFWFLTKILIFDKNFDFCPKIWFLTKILIFAQKFDFCPNIWFLTKILIQNLVQTLYKRFFTKFSIQFWSLPNRFLTKKCDVVPNFLFVYTILYSCFFTKITIFIENFNSFEILYSWTKFPRHGISDCEIFWTLGKGQRKIDFQLGKWGDHWLSITVWFRLGGVVLLVRLY